MVEKANDIIKNGTIEKTNYNLVEEMNTNLSRNCIASIIDISFEFQR